MTILKTFKWMIVASLFTIMFLFFWIVSLLNADPKIIVDPYVVIGKTKAEITQIYGEFDMESEEGARYLIDRNTYMRITFDEEGKADRCRIGKLPGG